MYDGQSRWPPRPNLPRRRSSIAGRYAPGVGREAPIAAGRRAVTALFADVAGSTQLGAELDPEDVVEVVGGAVRHFCEIVEQYGGTVKDLAGDGILALFGTPNAHPHTEGIDRGPPGEGSGVMHRDPLDL